MHLMHPVVFNDMQFGNYIKALHGIGKYWKKWLNVLFLQLNFRREKIFDTCKKFYFNFIIPSASTKCQSRWKTWVNTWTTEWILIITEWSYQFLKWNHISKSHFSKNGNLVNWPQKSLVKAIFNFHAPSLGVWSIRRVMRWNFRTVVFWKWQLHEDPSSQYEKSHRDCILLQYRNNKAF